MKTTIQPHIAWIDLVRVVACFMVLIPHSCDTFVGQVENNMPEYLSGVSWGSLVRACVPLFVMISGVLLLPVKTDMATFYSRRLKKIVMPLIFWSLALPILFYLYLSAASSTSPNIDMTDHTAGAMLNKLYSFIFNFNYDTTPFWYLYMLVGLYLVIPVVGAWLAQASRRDIKTVLAIWGVTLLIPYLQLVAPSLGYKGNYGNMGLLGVCDWNAYGMFYYFSGFAGYLVLAHYLVKFPLNWSWTRTIAVASTCFAAGYAATLWGFLFAYDHFGTFAYCEIIWSFCSINVAMMTVALFIVIQKMKVEPTPLLSLTSYLTFGIYLVHFIIVQMGYDLIHTNIALPAYLQIPLIALSSFVVSGVIVWVMSKSRILKKVI